MYRNVALIVLVALTSSAFGGPNWDKLEANKNECATEVGIDTALVSGPLKKDGNFMDDPKMRCFGACMMKKFGEMNDDGTVNVEKMVEIILSDPTDRDTFSDAVKECGTKKGDTDCETAYEIFKCFVENKVPMPQVPSVPQ